jgi:tetratricopeptide (TPR) repeat protein
VAVPSRITGRRKWALRAALAVLAPVAFLALVELGLRASGYGHSTRFFVPRPDGDGFVINPRFGWRFADPAVAPQPLPVVLPAAKAPDTRRIFILGEDAALGTPDPTSGFARVLEAMLRHRHPGTRFEVVNCAVPGINSHAILPIAEDCARHQPDLLVVYAGHNEAAGPFGASSSPRPLVRASLWARSLRVGQLAESLARRVRLTDAPTPEKLIAASRVPPDDPRRQAVRDRFRANLAGTIAAGRGAGAPVVACTVAANLRDCPPFASAHRPGLSDADLSRWDQAFRAGVALEEAGRHGEAAEQYRAAEQIDDAHAELHYRLARCHLALQNPADARRHLVQAREADGLPLRAGSGVNEVVRELAGGREADGVYIADVERALEQDPRSPHGLPGRELFWDHTHLRFEGNYAAARAVLGPVEAALGLTGTDPPPSEGWCAEQLVVTALDRRRCAERVLRMTARPPFTGQLDHAQRQEEQVRALSQMAVSRPELARDAERYTAALAARPDDWLLRANFARLLLATGRANEAVAQWDTIGRALPGSVLADQEVGPALLAPGRFEEAAERYRKAIAADPNRGRAYRGLGDALAGLGKLDEAAEAYAAAVRLDPSDAATFTGLGRLRMAQGDSAGARTAFEAAVALGPDADAEHQFGLLLMAREGKPGEALPRFQRACQLQPTDTRYQNSCGAALLAVGRPADAADRFRTAIKMDLNYSQAHAALARVEAARGRQAEAAAFAREAAERKYDRPTSLEELGEALTHYGAALLALGDTAGARACFESTLDLTASAEAEFQLGTVLLKEGKPDEALPRLDRAALLNPKDRRAPHNAGTALLALGKPDEAAERFRTAIQRDPNYAPAHASLGQIALAQNRPAEALLHYRRAVELKHDPPPVLAALAWLLATAPDPKVRDGPQAVRLAEEACRRTHRGNVNCLDALSAAYAAVGRVEEALNVALEAVALANSLGDTQSAAVIGRRIPALKNLLDRRQ